MTVKKFKVFDLNHVLNYFVLCFMLPLIACAQAVRYNYFQHSNHIPLPGWIAMIGAMLGFALGNITLFKARYDFNKQITGYTDTGVAVIMPTWIKDAPAFAQIAKDVDGAVAFASSFWQKAYPNTLNTMEAFVNGPSYLGFTQAPIDLLVHAPGTQLILPSNFVRWAVGATDYKTAACMWKPGETWTANVLPRVFHEVGHICLNAINVEDDTQDTIMAQDKYPY